MERSRILYGILFSRPATIFSRTKRGGLNNARFLLLYFIYENAFSCWDSSYAATLTVVLVLILAIFTIIQFAVVEERIHYQWAVASFL